MFWRYNASEISDNRVSDLIDTVKAVIGRCPIQTQQKHATKFSSRDGVFHPDVEQMPDVFLQQKRR